mmetsp:Transcript_5574/g.18894  ORF Transcript_5574/g.18894 Transcript_5574/m.18894 type:complete len:210 (-) Transcript_5574:1079-1708(-)
MPSIHAPAFSSPALDTLSARARSPRHHDVVNLEDHAHALGGEGNGGGVHEHGHHHVLLEDVRDGPLAHVDPGVFLPCGVLVAQLAHNVDRVEARVLRQRVRHHLEGLRKELDAKRLHAKELVGPVRQAVGGLRLGGPAAGGQEALLHQAAQHAERVVDGPVRLVENELVGRTDEDGHRLARVGHARDADDLAVRRRLLGDEVRLAELVG